MILGQLKNNFKCSNDNKTTGGFALSPLCTLSYRNSTVTCTPKERQEAITNNGVHTSENDFADTHTPCMQGTRTLSPLPTNSRFKLLFTSFKSPSFRYKATCVTCPHNKQPKELQQADLSVEARHRHRLTIAPLGGKKIKHLPKSNK